MRRLPSGVGHAIKDRFLILVSNFFRCAVAPLSVAEIKVYIGRKRGKQGIGLQINNNLVNFHTQEIRFLFMKEDKLGCSLFR